MAVDFREKSEILRDDIYHEEVDPSLVFNPLHVVYFFSGFHLVGMHLGIGF